MLQSTCEAHDGFAFESACYQSCLSQKKKRLEQLEELFVRDDVRSSLMANKLAPRSDASLHLAAFDDHGWKLVLLINLFARELDAACLDDLPSSIKHDEY